MKCEICGVPEGEAELFEGISIGEMVVVCESCAEEEGIPMIKKPSVDQLEKADERHSVRERMERLSGMRRVTPVSEEGSSSQALRARLKAPPQPQHDEKVVPNYHWNLTLARRRRKMTLGQVAAATGVAQPTLAAIERGRIPKDFEEMFLTLEDYFGIQLLSKHAQKINFVRKDPDYEKEILETVKEKMQDGSFEEAAPLEEEVPSTVTLNELIERKRSRDKKKKARQEQQKEDEMMGDDLDLELDEV